MHAINERGKVISARRETERCSFPHRARRKEGSSSKKNREPAGSRLVKSWSGQRDSNPRPSPWQGDALPAEPCPHISSRLEATPRFELGVKALQASALPLGHVAIPWRLSLQRPVKQEPDRPSDDNGADNGIRPRDPHLGKVMLYQLSHVRIARRYYKGSSQAMQALISRNSRLVRKRPPRTPGAPKTPSDARTASRSVRRSRWRHPRGRGPARPPSPAPRRPRPRAPPRRWPRRPAASSTRSGGN